MPNGSSSPVNLKNLPPVKETPNQPDDSSQESPATQQYVPHAPSKRPEPKTNASSVPSSIRWADRLALPFMLISGILCVGLTVAVNYRQDSQNRKDLGQLGDRIDNTNKTVDALTAKIAGSSDTGIAAPVNLQAESNEARKSAADARNSMLDVRSSTTQAAASAYEAAKSASIATAALTGMQNSLAVVKAEIKTAEDNAIKAISDSQKKANDAIVSPKAVASPPPTSNPGSRNATGK